MPPFVAAERVSLEETEELCGDAVEDDGLLNARTRSSTNRRSHVSRTTARQALLGVCAACAAVGVLVSVRPSLRPHASSVRSAPAGVHELLGLSLLGSGSISSSVEKEIDLDAPADFAPLLFCWTMIRSKGYEPDLMRAQFDNKAGIFACDDHRLYSNGGVVDIQGERTTKVQAPAAKMGNFSEHTTTNSWLNTEIFIRAWDLVMQEGKWWDADWTVKTDPDAIFFPNRLREQIAPYTRGLNAQPLYVGNCDRTWRPEEKPHLSMYGSLEIFSRNAMGTYNAFRQKCVKDLPWQKWGEDLYLQSCMHYLNVEVLNKTSFLADKRCYAAPCTDHTKVVFHDYKEVQPFFDCWGASRKAERAARSGVAGSAAKVLPEAATSMATETLDDDVDEEETAPGEHPWQSWVHEE